MGRYINPGNSAFAEINDSDYVDKTGLIEMINQTIGMKNKLTCVSRPRRFGKSFAARMLAAYYDCSCDSDKLFQNKRIAGEKDYAKHLNQYNVVYLELTSFVSSARRQNLSLSEVPEMIVAALKKDLRTLGVSGGEGEPLTEQMIEAAEKPGGRKFIFIIDEWDALIREAKNDEPAQRKYLDLLREWFKNSTFTPRAVAAAYMTGILPIKKDGSQSAISDFREYTMIKPRKFGEYADDSRAGRWCGSEGEYDRICKRSYNI